ncbi:SGNH/GDSL hydrolase family protein [Collimonas fungivorans]|uniref:Lipolytic enzyme, G-D-S-L family n=1 Tax=Collimonas fungivorans (strain Ter331) TaxID=1005048 RepID=G0AAG6_COLFT|nr:SGNH/GDSL hydrolase family protein [Collimonas fungivorans]AEK63180.1 lipolytic enzyme, G-D-S-L family [Collimonas fungivorans Ter331]
MPIDFTQFHACTTTACSTEMVAAFHLNQPIWDAGIVFDEPVLPTGGPANLWRKPTAIVMVSNRHTGDVYVQGQDYDLSDGVLRILPNSRIPMALKFPNVPNPGAPAIWQPFTKSGAPLRIASDYQQHQIAVTYTAGALGGLVPLIGSVPISARKISERSALAATIYGDSISKGDNATATINEAPHQPGWADLMGAMLSNEGDGEYYWRNVSVGGWDSWTGLVNVQEKVNTVASDLVIIGFGMNDASGGVTSKKFEENLRAMIAAIRKKSPETEFILVSSFLGNEDWKPSNNGLLRDYRVSMIRIVANTDGVALADMTALSESVLKSKSYYDITSNGVNHPGDFLHVGYAQVVSRAIR